MNSDIAAAAVRLATAGHPVLPLHSISRAGRCTCGRSCASPGKHPRLAHGLHDASSEPAVVADWFGRRWKLADLGVATGHGGLFVLDVDGAEGEDTLAQLEAEHGPLPLTRWVRTGSGGRHAYFRSQEHLGNSCRKVGPGLDGRGEGGYVVAPPSLHVSGSRYVWMNQRRAAQLPPWLLELLRPPARPSPAPIVRIGRTRGDYGRAALAGEEASVRMAPPGRRNTTLNSASFSLGQLVGGGLLDVDAVAGALLIAALASGLGETEPCGRLSQVWPPVSVARGGAPRERLSLRRQDHLVPELTGVDWEKATAAAAGASPRRGLVPVSSTVEPMPASAFFGERNNLVVARLGETIRQAGHIRTGMDGRLYRYESGVYRPDGETWARARVREALGDRVRRDHFSEVLTWLRSFEPTVGSRPPEHLLNVANGLLEWRSGVLYPHDPSVVTTIQLPVPWLPGARCPRIDKFLSEVVPPDTVEIVEEIMGYALYAANPLRKAVLLLGSGGNGKSKLLAMVAGLAGQRNVASVPVQVFGENRFASAELFGKLANIAGDLDARAIKRTDVFKMITGGDPIMAERKNCHPFSFVSYALPLFSANEPPISSDQTQAWFDRWIIVPMERRFEGAEGCDPNLEAKLTTEDELAGGLVMAVEGLRRLMRRGRFAEPVSSTGTGSTRCAGSSRR